MSPLYAAIDEALEQNNYRQVAALLELFPSMLDNRDLREDLKTLFSNWAQGTYSAQKQNFFEIFRGLDLRSILPDFEAKSFHGPWAFLNQGHDDILKLLKHLSQRPEGVKSFALETAIDNPEVKAWMLDVFELLTQQRPAYSERTIYFDELKQPVLGPHIRFVLNKDKAEAVCGRLDVFEIKYARMIKQEPDSHVVSIEQGQLAQLYSVLDGSSYSYDEPSFPNFYKKNSSHIQGCISTYFDMCFDLDNQIQNMDDAYDKLALPKKDKTDMLRNIRSQATHWVHKSVSHCVPQWFEGFDSDNKHPELDSLAKKWRIPKLSKLKLNELRSSEKYRLFGICVEPQALALSLSVKEDKNFTKAYQTALSRFLPESVQLINEPPNAQPLSWGYDFLSLSQPSSDGAPLETEKPASQRKHRL